MAAKRHVEVVIPELFDIYFNVIHHFHTIFNAEYSSDAICNFWDFFKEKKIQDGRNLNFDWEQVYFHSFLRYI